MTPEILTIVSLLALPLLIGIYIGIYSYWRKRKIKVAPKQTCEQCERLVSSLDIAQNGLCIGCNAKFLTEEEVSNIDKKDVPVSAVASKLRIAIIALRISSVIYFILGSLILVRLYSSEETIQVLIFGAVAFGLGIFIEIVIKGLKNNKFWAWVAGVVLFGTYLPSIFIVLGILGLIGLLDESVRGDFHGMSVTEPCAHCGKEAMSGSNFCQHCGQSVVSVEPLSTILSASGSLPTQTEVTQRISRQEYEEKLKRNIKIGLWWIIAPIALVVLAVLIHTVIIFLTPQLSGVSVNTSAVSGLSQSTNLPAIDVRLTFVRIINVALGLLGLLAMCGVVIGIPLGIIYLCKRELFPGTLFDPRSGKGPASEVPPEIKRWNWGAAGLTWVWGARHRVWRSFIIFIPFINFLFWIYLGLKGSTLAWRADRWESVDAFLARDRKWRPWGIAFFIFHIVLLALVVWGYIALPTNRLNREVTAADVIRDAIYGTNTAGVKNKKYTEVIRRIFDYLKEQQALLLPTEKKLREIDFFDFSHLKDKKKIAEIRIDLQNYLTELAQSEAGFQRAVVKAEDIVRMSNLSQREQSEIIVGIEQSINNSEKRRLVSDRMTALQEYHKKLLALYTFLYNNFKSYYIKADKNGNETIYLYSNRLVEQYNAHIAALRAAYKTYSKADKALVDYLNNKFDNNGLGLDVDSLRRYMTQ